MCPRFRSPLLLLCAAVWLHCAAPVVAQTPTVLEKWQQDLKSADPAVRIAAIQHAPRSGPYSAGRREALLALRADPVERVRVALARALLAFPDEHLAADWKEMAHDPAPAVRAEAIASLPVVQLGAFGIEALAYQLNDDDAEVREAAARRLAGFWEGRQVVDGDLWARLSDRFERIVVRLEDDSPKVRGAVVEFLGAGLNVPSQPQPLRARFEQELKAALGDADMDVRSQAALRLVRHGIHDAAVQVELCRAIPRWTGDLRQEAFGLIERCGSRLYEGARADPQVVVGAVATFLKAPGDIMPLRALNLLEACGANARLAGPEVVRVWQNGSPEVKRAALKFLRRFPTQARGIEDPLESSLPGAPAEHRREVRELLAAAGRGVEQQPDLIWLSFEEIRSGLRSQDAGVRHAAVRAVGRETGLTPGDRTRVLASALVDPDPGIRAAAVEAILAAPVVRSQHLVEECRAPLRDPSPQVRLAALSGMRLAQWGADAADLVVPCLADADPQMRRLAAIRLVERPASYWYAFGVRAETGEKGVPALRLETLDRLLQDGDPLVRWAALEFIGTAASIRIRGSGKSLLESSSELQKQLEVALGGEDPVAATIAAAHLSELPHAIEDRVLEAALTAGPAFDAKTRARMVRIVGLLRERPRMRLQWEAAPSLIEHAVAALGKALNDPEDEVREAAAESLRRFGTAGAAAAPEMAAAFRSGSLELRRQILGLFAAFPAAASVLESELHECMSGRDVALRALATSLFGSLHQSRIAELRDPRATGPMPSNAIGKWWEQVYHCVGYLMLALAGSIVLRKMLRRKTPEPLPDAAPPTAPSLPLPAATTRRWVRSGRAFTSRAWEGRGADTEVEARLDHPLLPRFQVVPRGLSAGVSERLPVKCTAATGIADFDERFEVRMPQGSTGALPPLGEVWLQLLLVANLCRKPGLVLEADGANVRCRLLGGIGPQSQRIAVFHQVCRLLEMVLHRYDMGAPVIPVELLILEAGSAQAEVVCRVCGEGIGETPLRCGRCATPHHRECWEYAGKCSIFGCGGAEAK